jgi:signal transduction histidine kinase
MINTDNEIVWDVSLTRNEMRAVTKALSISIDKLTGKLETLPAHMERQRQDAAADLAQLTSALDEVRRVYHEVLAA